MIETKVKIRYIFALTLTVLFTHQSTWGASADIDTTLTQKSAAAWSVEMSGMCSNKKALPFWSHTNKGGIVPETCGGLIHGDISGTTDLKHNFRFGYGIGLAGYAALPGYEDVHNVDGSSLRGMIPSLYANIGWKKLSLDLGIRQREMEFGNLSVTGGDLTWTNNTMSLPGYNLKTDWINVPFTKERLAIKFNIGDYGMWDNRFVKHTLLHSQSLYFKVALTRKLSFTGGMEAWAQWAGNSPLYGVQPHGFGDYLKIMVGAGGDSSATESDQINALGNHLGRELIRFDWEDETWHLVFQHDRPFDDGSGIGFQNFPDAVNTLYLNLKDKDRWVNEFLVEFIYTKWQSGTRHDRPATPAELKKNPNKTRYVIGGCDDYFNNGEYRSGWTYNGRTIGLPLFFPYPKDMNGITYGVINNRIVSWNAGIGGKIARRIPYNVKITYSRNFGRYNTSQTQMYQQVSGAFECSLPEPVFHKTTGISLGLYADKGSIYPDTAGITIKLYWGGYLGHNK